MINLKAFAAAALVTTAIAVAPSFAQEGGIKGGGQAAGAVAAPRAVSGGGAGASMGAGPRMSGGAGASVNARPMMSGNAGAGRVDAGAGFRASQRVQSTGQVTQQQMPQQRVAQGSWDGQRSGNWNNDNWNNNNNGNWNGGWNHQRRYRGGQGFTVGIGIGPGYYGYDNYAYNDYPYYDDSYAYYGGDQGYVSVNAGADPAYCAQRYRSYDPASGTFLGYDGLRHPCP